MGLKAVQQHGEAGSATIASVDLAKTAVPLVIRGYSADDVYNQDETGLFWRQLPTRRLATGKQAGHKKEKIRVPISVTCNASGTDKRGLFLIGTAKKPRSFPSRFNPETAMNIRYPATGALG